ncbi:MAG: hypothetical protein RL329_649, partial [Bacteroidota bacterium]
MKYTFFIILYLFWITPIAAQRLVDVESDCIAPLDTSIDRFNQDNTIYHCNKEFIFDYTIIKEQDSLYCQFIQQRYGLPDWLLVSKKGIHPAFTVRKIGMAILPSTEEDSQSWMVFRYYDQADSLLAGWEKTGLIDNPKNIWLHPPRSGFFAVTEFNSFPFIKQPYKIGTAWKSGLTAGYFENYKHFGLKWKGILITKETLSIIDVVELTTPFGVLPCYVVEGFVKSDLTDTRT